MAWGAIAGAVAGPLIGGLLSDGGGGGGGGQQTSTRSPYAPAEPWLKRQITDGQALQDRYAADPFNAQQKTAYQNTFDDIDNYRRNIAPGIMDFANNAMTSTGYQRQQRERPGMAGYGPRPTQQPQQPQQQPQQLQQPGGLLAPERSGPFSVSGRPGLMHDGASYAPIDFEAQKAPPRMAPQEAPAVNQADEMQRLIDEREARWRRVNPDDGGGS